MNTTNPQPPFKVSDVELTKNDAWLFFFDEDMFKHDQYLRIKNYRHILITIPLNFFSPRIITMTMATCIFRIKNLNC